MTTSGQRNRRPKSRGNLPRAPTARPRPAAPNFDRDAGRTRIGRRSVAEAGYLPPPRRAASGPTPAPAGKHAGQGRGRQATPTAAPRRRICARSARPPATSAWHGRCSRTTEDLIEALAARGIKLAEVSAEEARQSERDGGLRQGSRTLRPRAGGKARSSPSTRMATCTGSTSAPPATCAPRSRRGLTASPASIAPAC